MHDFEILTEKINYFMFHMNRADLMGCWQPIIFAPVAIFFPLWKREDARSLLTPHLWSSAVLTARCLGLWALERL